MNQENQTNQNLPVSDNKGNAPQTQSQQPEKQGQPTVQEQPAVQGQHVVQEQPLVQGQPMFQGQPMPQGQQPPQFQGQPFPQGQQPPQFQGQPFPQGQRPPQYQVQPFPQGQYVYPQQMQYPVQTKRPSEPFNLFVMLKVLFTQGPSAFFHQKPSFSSRLTLYLASGISALLYIIAASFTRLSALDRIQSMALKPFSNIFNGNLDLDVIDDIATGDLSNPLQLFQTTSIFSIYSFLYTFFIILVFVGLGFLFTSLAQKRGLGTPNVNFSTVCCVVSASMIFMAPLFLLGALFNFVPFVNFRVFGHAAMLSFMALNLWGMGSVLNNKENYLFKISLILFPHYLFLNLF